MLGFLKNKNKKSPIKKAVKTVIETPVSIEVINASSSDIVWTKEFPQASNFRGFKRVKLKHIGIDGIEGALSHFRGSAFDFKNSTVKISCIRTVRPGEEDRLSFDVFVDGKKIGVVPDYNFDAIGLLANTDIDKVFLQVDESYHADGTPMGQNIYLFVHPSNTEQ